MTGKTSGKTNRRYSNQRKRLQALAPRIVDLVCYKDREYGSSWRKRGGAGAFMVIARKWDRIENACEREDGDYNIFRVFANDDRAESIAHDCIDLTGYLLVLLEHMIEMGYVKMEDLHKITQTGDFSQVEVTGDIPKLTGSILGVTGMDKPFGFDEEEDLTRAELDADPQDEEGNSK